MGGNRFRISHKKASTGCGTCRNRRVKCDEQKPFCQRCRNAGRVCDGYKAQNQFVVFVAPQTRAQISDGFENDHERRFFDYFRSISAAEFSRFFDQHIWRRLILQAAHTVPAIKHAVVAVASSHESFKAESVWVPWNLSHWPDARMHAQSEYNKAIALLRVQLEKEKSQCLPAVLTCGLIFVCLEMLGGNAQGALTHLEACIRILNGITSKRDPASPKDIIYIQPQTALTTEVEQDLLPIFTRLDSMASQGVIGRVPSLKHREPEGDYSFSSFSEAAQALYAREHAEHALSQPLLSSRYGLEITHGGFGVTLVQPFCSDYLPIEVIASAEKNLRLLTSWEAAFAVFVSKHPPKTEVESRGYLLLQIHHKIVTMKISMLLCTEESDYDNRLSIFKDVLNLVKIIFDRNVPPAASSAILPRHKRPTPTWSVETGIIRPLNYIVWKCRDGFVRRDALYMLERCAQEGIWNPDMEAPPLRRLMEIEEDMVWGSSVGDWLPTSEHVYKTCADIPEWRRIHFAWKAPVPGQRKHSIFCWSRPDGPDGGWRVDTTVVDWLPKGGV